MFENWWMANFRPRRYEEPKETIVTKFVVSATVLGIILFLVLYLCIFLLRDESNKFQGDLGSRNSSINETLATPEKLISSEFMKNLFQPMPFLNSLRGPQPTSFVSPQPEQDRHDLTTPNYPQLSNYARPGLPRNIQEIIGYLSPFASNNNKQSYQLNDPFFAFKPKDPSEVNLLAPTSLRFAPPAWKILKSSPNLFTSQSTQKENFQKFNDLMLTLNVFPVKEDENRENYYGTLGDPVLSYGRKLPKPRKMVIHLNIYDEDWGKNNDISGFENVLRYDTNNIRDITERNE